MDFSGIGARQSESPPSSPLPQVPRRRPEHVLNAEPTTPVAATSQSHETVRRSGSMSIPPVTIADASPDTAYSSRPPIQATQSMASRTQPTTPTDGAAAPVPFLRNRSASTAAVVVPAPRMFTESPEMQPTEALATVMRTSSSGGNLDSNPRLLHAGESVLTYAEAHMSSNKSTPSKTPRRASYATVRPRARTLSNGAGPLGTSSPLVPPRGTSSEAKRHTLQAEKTPHTHGAADEVSSGPHSTDGSARNTPEFYTRRASTPGGLILTSVLPSSPIHAPADSRNGEATPSTLSGRGRVSSHDSLARDIHSVAHPVPRPRSRSNSVGKVKGQLPVSTTHEGRLSPSNGTIHAKVRPTSPLVSSLSQPNNVGQNSGGVKQPKSLRQTTSHNQVGDRPVVTPRRPPSVPQQFVDT